MIATLSSAPERLYPLAFGISRHRAGAVSRGPRRGWSSRLVDLQQGLGWLGGWVVGWLGGWVVGWGSPVHFGSLNLLLVLSNGG